MSSFFSFLKTKKIPDSNDLVLLATPPLTLPKLLIGVIGVAIIGTMLSLFLYLSKQISIEIPDYGGTLKEGVIGAPHFINPFLAKTETDKLLTSLIFNGLVGYDNTGNIIPVLAESYTVSPDGMTAEFILRDHLLFSNGKPITSSDVAFSLQTYKRLNRDVPEGGDWSDVSVETTSDKNIILRTSKKNPSILQYATKPIVSRNIWEQIPIESFGDSSSNMKPVGSGPYTLKGISYKNTLPQMIKLRRNSHYVLRKTYIDSIDIMIFANQLATLNALIEGDITSTTILDPIFINSSVQKNFSIQTVPLPTTVSLYQNKTISDQTKNILTAINPFIDRKAIIDTIENGYGIPLVDTTTTSDSVFSGLERLGYKKDMHGKLSKQGVPISISIALRKDDSLMKTAAILADQFEALGIMTEIKVFDQGVFIDELDRQSFPLLLEKTDTNISGYMPVIPLYRKTLLHTKINSLVTPKITGVQTKEQYWASTPSWSLVTDTVWKWFTKR